MRFKEFTNARAAVKAAAGSQKIVVYILGDKDTKAYSREEAEPVIMGLFKAGYSLRKSCQAEDTGNVFLTFRRPEND